MRMCLIIKIQVKKGNLIFKFSVTNLKSTNFSDYSKKTYSMLMDKFIQRNPGLD